MIGVIGGTGLYDLPLEGAEWKKVGSPFGTPSDDILVGTLDGHPLAFLPRHGRGHRIPPHQIEFRANIDALKRAGVTQILSLSAVGSLRADLAPGTFVLIDQFVDRTLRPNKTFFTTGCVAHVSMAHPTCVRMLDALEGSGDPNVVRGGTYVAMEGPQFSSLAESRLHRQLECDVVGMTNMPEAKLAREAELCYATIAMVTDFDCWHPDHDHVKVEDVVRVLHANAERARQLVQRVVPALATASAPCPHGCDRALDNAILTAPSARDPELVAKLDAVAGRVLES